MIVFLPSFLVIVSATGSSLVSKIVDIFTLAEVLIAAAFLSKYADHIITEPQNVKNCVLIPKSSGSFFPKNRQKSEIYSAQDKSFQTKRIILSIAFLLLGLLLLIWFRENAFILGTHPAVLSNSSLLMYATWSVIDILPVARNPEISQDDFIVAPAGFAAVDVYLTREKRPLEAEGFSGSLPPFKVPPKFKSQTMPIVLNTPESGTIKRARSAKTVSIGATTELTQRISTPRNKAAKRLISVNLGTKDFIKNFQEPPLATLTALNLLHENEGLRMFSLQGTPFNTSIETFTTRRAFRETERTQQSQKSGHVLTNKQAVEDFDSYSSLAPTAVDLFQINPVKLKGSTFFGPPSNLPLHLELIHFGLVYWIFRNTMVSMMQPAKVLRFFLLICIKILSRFFRRLCQIVFFLPILLVRVLIKLLKIGSETTKDAFKYDG